MDTEGAHTVTEVNHMLLISTNIQVTKKLLHVILYISFYKNCNWTGLGSPSNRYSL